MVFILQTIACQKLLRELCLVDRECSNEYDSIYRSMMFIFFKAILHSSFKQIVHQDTMDPTAYTAAHTHFMDCVVFKESVHVRKTSATFQ
jgi:hypothetical protein